ncbi:MAG: fibronectin type III domain-containing protein [Agathobacter sp.]|nr:fibronectin type III domain-containing protein [Agathobacter sp.]
MKVITMKTRKQYITMFVMGLLFSLAVLMGGAKQNVYAAEAPSGTVDGVKQTGATTSSVDLQFNTLLDTQAQYEIRVSTQADSGYTAMTTTSASFTTLSGLAAGNTYYIKVVPFYAGADGAGNTYGAESSVLSVVTSPAAAPAAITQTGSGANYITIAWSQVSGANGYFVDYCLTDGTASEKVRITSGSTSANLYGVISSKKYTAYVTPYRMSEAGYVAYDSSLVISKSNLAISGSNSGTPQGKVTGFAQTQATNNSAQITFTTLNDAAAYYSVQLSQNATTGFEECAAVTEGRYTFSDLKVGTTYYVRVVPFYQNWNYLNEQYDRVYGTASDVFAIATAGGPAGKISGLSQVDATVDSAQITFNALKDANVSYSVQLSRSATGQFSEVATVTDGEYTFSDLKGGSTYYVRIIPFYKNQNSTSDQDARLYGTASAAFEIVTAPSTKPRSITQTKATKTGFTVQWDKVSGASGYYVDYYCAGSTKQIHKSVKKNTIKLTKLKTDKEYHVFVTPYKKSASGFVAVDETNYTAKYNIPVKPGKADKPAVEKYWSSLGKVIAGTNQIACADGYQYQVYTAYKDKDTKIKTAYSTSYSSVAIQSEKLKSANVFKMRVRAYITVAGKKVYGAWSDWTYMTAPQKVTLSRSSNTIKASWSKVNGADRYAVYISKNKTYGYKKCAVTDKTTFQIKKYGKSSIEKNATYYVYVVPQIKAKDVYVSTAKRDAVSEIK